MEFVNYTIENIIENIRTGGTPLTSNQEYFNGEIIWLTPSDLDGQKTIQSSGRKVTELAIKDKQAFLFNSGTVIISTIGEIGKTCIVKEALATNQQLTGIDVKRALILPDLFYYWILRNKELLKYKANKAVIPILSNKTLKRIKLSFPKNNTDQLKIVAHLDKIQELIYRRIETINLLDKYIQSLFIEMFGDPIKDNFNIGKKRLSFFGDWKSGGTPTRSETKYFDGTIPWFTSGELNDFYVTDSRDKITDEAIRNTSAKLVTKNSILIGMYDTAALKCSINTIDTSCNQAIAYCKLNEELCHPIFILFNIVLGKSYHLNKRKGARQKNLNLTKIKDIEVLYPPLNMQMNFISKFEVYYQIKCMYKESLLLLESFFKVTLQNAFNEEKQADEKQIDEKLVFEELLKSFSIDDLQEGDRTQYLIDWINNNKPLFSSFDYYDMAWNKTIELLEKGSISQVLENNEIKLKVK